MVMEGGKPQFKKSKHKKGNKKEMIEDSIVDKIKKIKSKNVEKQAPPVETLPAPAAEAKISDKKMKRKKSREDKRAKEEGGVEAAKAAEPDKEPELMLTDILDLGGTQDDFDLLKAIDDKEEEIVSEKLEEKPSFDIGELVTFMHASGMTVPKKKKKKKEVVAEAEVAPVAVAAVTEAECPSVPDSCPTPEKLFFKANEPWYTDVNSSKSIITYNKTGKWFYYAQQLWDNEVALAHSLRDKHQSNDQQWLKTVLTGGTMNDKISAHCMLAQESPVHHIKSVEALFGMAKKKSKRLAIQALDNIKELFVSSLLPDCKKLILFKHNDFSLLTGDQADKMVLTWLVEHRLKELYSEYIELIKVHIGDTEVAIRTKLCNLIFQLLNEKPEKEQELLGLLVNKIGDPDKKLASKIIYILGQLLQNHPSMKMVVSSEVERILYRSNISERAQYYGICFLNQLQLSEEESKFAAHLIKIYFSFFKEIIDKKNIDSRMLGGLLTGVNRAYPYTCKEDGLAADNIATLFKLVYVSNFNVSVQALMLLFQVSGSKPDISDRYYQALYSKLIDSSINSSSKKTFLLNLIYKSLKRDTSVVRKVALARRLLQVSALDDPLLACASLYTIAVANKEAEAEGLAKAKEKTKEKPEEVKEEAKVKEVKGDSYNPLVRNPLFSNADKLELWEFNLLAKHYHPSVVQFVTTLLEEGNIMYSGDPFNDFTMMKFLDKFVFKNPKKDVKATSKKFYTKHMKESSLQVYSSEFKDQKESQVSADEKFFFEYFKSKKETPDKAQKEEGEEESHEDLDFAEDIKTIVAQKKDKKKKKTVEEDDDDEESDAGSDFSYGDMEDDGEDADEVAGDKIYEKMLWENLDSEGESLHGDSEGEEGGEEMEEMDDSDNSVDLDAEGEGDSDSEDLILDGMNSGPNSGEDSESEPDFDEGEFADGDDFEEIITKSQMKTKSKKLLVAATEEQSNKKPKILKKRKGSESKANTKSKKKKS